MQTITHDEETRLALVALAKKKQLISYQKNPLLWLKERFREDTKAFEWSAWGNEYQNHIWDADKDPLALAWQHIADNHWVGVESATGIGKTFFLARVVFWFLDCFENSLVVTTTPKEAQLKLQLWSEITKAFPKFKRIRPNAELLNLRLIVDNSKSESDTTDINAGWQAIGFVAGTGADEESATKAQGFHRKDMLIILEETPGISLPVLTAFKNTSTGDHNIIIALGNPDSQTDNLHSFCKLPHVKHVRCSAYDFPNVVLGREVVGGAVGVKSIEIRRDELGADSPMYNSRVRGISPAQALDSLIRLEWIEQCIYKNIDKSQLPKNGAVGIDVANSETGDKASVAIGKGNTLLYLKDFQCPDASHLAYNFIYDTATLTQKKYHTYQIPMLKDYNIQPTNVGIDGVGVGVSTVQTFKNEKKDVISLQGGQLAKVIPTDKETKKPLYNFTNLRSQMYWELREDLRNDKIRICIDDYAVLERLKQELCIPKVILGEKTQVESKDTIKKRLGNSPNLADSVAYWNWIRKGYYVKTSMFLGIYDNKTQSFL
jgi:hypothetical protein